MAKLNIGNLDDYVDDLGDTNTTTFTDAQKHRAYDRWQNNITEEINMAMADYDFQGEYAIRDLSPSATTREYLFPTDIFTIKRIDITLDGVNWKQCRPLDASELSNHYATEAEIVNRFSNEDPRVDFFDNSYVIYCGAIPSTVTGGIRVTYSKEIVGQASNGDDITNFTADADVSNLPEFAKLALVYGALIDFFTKAVDDKMLAKFNNKLYGNPQGRPAKQDQIGGLLRQILTYYSSKAPDKEIRMGSVYDEKFDFN